MILISAITKADQLIIFPIPGLSTTVNRLEHVCLGPITI